MDHSACNGEMNVENNQFSISDASSFINQVAGHTDGKVKDFLKYGEDKLLKRLKPDRRGQVEESYYKAISSSSVDEFNSLFHRFTPTYYYTLFNPESASYYLCLKDVSAKFKNPSLIDIKIGHVTWESDCLDSYKINKFPHSKEIKFRICGMKVCSSPGQHEVYGKEYGKRLNPGTTMAALKLFFTNGKRFVKPIIKKLRDLLDLFERQRNWRFISSSLLIIYENFEETEGPNDAFEIKMIDFAHASPTNTLDTNYIEGLTSLIIYFNSINFN